MTTLFAQSYDITANGFYFDTVEDYNENAEKNRNSAGFPVEEYELQFIDGESIDAALLELWMSTKLTSVRFWRLAKNGILPKSRKLLSPSANVATASIRNPVTRMISTSTFTNSRA
jgi:hypothetical protein